MSELGLSGDNDCHFTWNLEENDEEGDPETILERQMVKLEANREIELMSLLLISYLHCKTKPPNYDASLEVVNNCVDKCQAVDGPNRGQAMGFEVTAMRNKLHILRKLNRPSEALETEEQLSNIKIDDQSQAAIFGSRAYALSIFGPKNYEESLQFYIKARKLDPKCYLWCFGIGYISGRIRRYLEGVQVNPTEIEEENFRTACELSNWQQAIPIVFLADDLFSRGRERKAIDVREDKKLTSEAKELFLKAYELNPDSTQILKRCGKAFAVMKCEELGEKCLKRAVELDPRSSQSFHRLAQIYEFSSSRKNLALAEKRYLQAMTAGRRRNFFAECDLARARHKQNKAYDLLGHYRQMKQHYENDAQRLGILDEKIKSQIQFESGRKNKQQYRKF